jgi:hypothetical protein
MVISIHQIEELIEFDNLSASTKDKLKIFLLAINDWPKQIDTLFDFEKEIQKFIGNEINKNKLLNIISNIDYTNDAWEAESLSYLIEIYNYYEEDKFIDIIFNEIHETLLSLIVDPSH